MRLIIELFLFFLVLIGLTDGYIYRKYVRHWKSVWAKRIYWIPSICLLIAMCIIFWRFEPKPEPMSRFCSFLVVFLCIQLPKAIFTLLSLLLRPLAKAIHRHFYETTIACSIALFTMGYLIYGATEGIRHFQVKEVTIQSDDVPEGFNGYRIIQLSDMHLGSWNGDTQAMQKAVQLINEQKVDLIVFTGDLVNNLADEVNDFLPLLSQLKAKDGVYSVLGNHDYSMYIKWENEADRIANLDSLKAKQAQMGWQLLNNRHVKLYQAGDSIALIGVENSGRPPFPDFAHLDEAMQGTEGMFKILLSHDPTHWRREVLPKTDIQLMLAGHTHAMQTKIFGFSPAQFIYPENDGLYQEEEQMLYVNIGLGHLMFPMRLGAWPEISLFTLRN